MDFYFNSIKIIVGILMHSTLEKKCSTDDNLKYFFYFSQKSGVDILYKLPPLDTNCMKCQILFSGKKLENIINLSSAGLAQRVAKVYWINMIMISPQVTLQQVKMDVRLAS